MSIKFNDKFLLFAFHAALFNLLLNPIACLAGDGDAASPPPEMYGGFSMNLLVASPNVTPIRETTQDLDALLVGNGLSPSTLAANQTPLQDSLIPYVPTFNTPSGPSVHAANVNLQALATTMGLSTYKSIATQASIDYAITLPTTSATTSTLLWGTAAASQAVANNEESGISQVGNVIWMNHDALAPFNIRSITNPATYSATNSQKYLGLVSGSAVPVTGMLLGNDNTFGVNGGHSYPAYQLAVAREAAVQSAAVGALQTFAEGNVPLTNTPASALGNNFVKSNLIPTQNNITSFMATRRLNPDNNWYYRIQQASPLELQRESLYLQAESLYELDKIRQQNQQNTLLLSLLLIEQSRAAISGLNMQTTMSPPQASTTTPAKPSGALPPGP